MSTPSSGSAHDAGSHETTDAKPKGGGDDHGNQRDHGDEEGEDEGGAPTEGDYSGLKEKQKPVDR